MTDRCVHACVELKSVDEVKSSISHLYSHLNVEQFQLEREHQLQSQLEDLQQQIEPFEQVRCHIYCVV